MLAYAGAQVLVCGRGDPDTDVHIFDHVPTFISAAKWSMDDLADPYAHLVIILHLHATLRRPCSW